MGREKEGNLRDRLDDTVRGLKLHSPREHAWVESHILDIWFLKQKPEEFLLFK